ETVGIEGMLDGAREHDLTGAGALTQPRSNVHGITYDGVTHVGGGPDVARDHIALVDADAESRLDLVAPLPRLGELGEATEHLARRQDRSRGAVGLLERHTETKHQAVARHMKHRAVVAKGDLGQQ